MPAKRKKGICTHKSGFYGWVTVSDKGQIAIPANVRKELKIKTGNKLLVLRRKNSDGISLVKPEVISKHLNKLRD
ncbi:AbrB/MazE/SpoVT family DNA-binding domain-containing protein [Patescibacteria group bacterium]|nr:AbrB/MazE/SpoVT family DNA-binding domain-containing protein [Patescibacteria group bacterium]